MRLAAMPANAAPIVISVYDRLGHLQQCIESLKQNPLSQQSDLFIVSDAAHSAAHEDRIAKVRDYISQIDGFKCVIPLIRAKNLGSYVSVKSAIDDVISIYGTVIFLEDDNVVSPNFLNFVNDGLAFHQDNPKIFSISGYNYPVTIPESYQHDVYMWQGFTAWGVGLWEDRWHAVTWNYAGFNAMSARRKRELNAVAEHLHSYISYDIAHGRMIIDTIVSYWMFMHSKYSIFPVLSKVRNTGQDGTGEHSHVNECYLRQPIDQGLPYQFVRDLQPDERINRILWRHFRTPLRAKLIMALSPRVPAHAKRWLNKRLST